MRPEYKLYPEDFEKERAIGISLPFNKSALSRPVNINYSSGSMSGLGVFESTYTTEDQAITNLINLILTRKGERYMQPLFGTDVPDFVFEQNTRTNRFQLANSLRTDIAFWLPYIVLGDLRVEEGSPSTPGDPQHSVTIIIPFKVTENGANRTVTFFIGQQNTNFEVN